ncbi:hypothetical protein JYK21_01145 [Ralstonia pickettii]|nr:hypothetical protein [Ralstonia pickettii]
MSRKKGNMNVIGDRYGRLLIVDDVHGIKPRRVVAVCDCGTKKEYLLHNLRSGLSKSCGCLQKERAAKRLNDLTGKVFGKLTVIKRVENVEGRNIPRWLCHCKCGNKTVVYANNLISKFTRSCGCEKGGHNCKKWTEKDDKQIVHLKNAGMSVEEISRLVERSPSTLYKRLNILQKNKESRDNP